MILDFLVYIIPVVFVLGFLLLASRYIKNRSNTWGLFARNQQLFFNTARGQYEYPVVHGKVDGRSFLLGRFKRGSSYTLIEMGLNKELPEGTYFGADHFHSSIIKRLTLGEDIETGDPKFDKKVIVKGKDVHNIISYLDVGKRETIIELTELGAEVCDNKIRIKSRRDIRQLDKLEEIFSELIRLALKLEE